MAQSRRDFLRGGAAAAAGLVAARAALADPAPQHEGHTHPSPQPSAPAPAPAAPAPRTRGKGGRAEPPVPVLAPDVGKLPWRWEGGVKVFHLIAEVVRTQFTPWKTANVWGYNGSSPGPTIEAMEGDRVRIILENRLPEATVPHWHGLEIPIEMDGVEGLTQDFIPPGGSYTYEFTLRQNGTFFYHSHRPMQQMMGMVGLFIIHPKRSHEPRCDRDFAFVLQEWATLPNNPTPNSLAMEFNWLTMNGKAGPATTPVLAKLGERVRLRFVNLGMDHHPVHMHGHTWITTGAEGGRYPRELWRPGNTELIGVAQARDLEFVADNPGDWMLHCHLPHHMMNAMVSMVGPLSTPAPGVPTGQGMEEGMGIPSGGHALSHDMGPSMGRTTGVDAEQPANHLVGPGGHGAHGGPLAHQGGPEAVAPNARQVPGYPQDMFMVMDDAVTKPETYGLRPGWTGAMMGMMTLVRVLPPAKFDEIMALKARQGDQPAASADHSHHGGGQ